MKKLLLAMLIVSLGASLISCTGGESNKTTTAGKTTAQILTRDPSAVTDDVVTTEETVEATVERDLYGLGKFVEYAEDEQYKYIVYENGAAISEYKGNSTEITLPTVISGTSTSVSAIATHAFRDSEIIKVAIPEGYTVIGNGAFYKCEKLASVSLPSTLEKLSDNAFMYAGSLSSITIPDSTENLGDSVFFGCESLKFCKLPAGITKIPDSLFYGCSSLVYELPEGIDAIGDSAFYYCTSLTNITIPNSCKTIGSEAFYYCKGVTTLSIPNGVETIGDYAFFKNSGITNLSIPSSVIEIGNYAFFGLDKISAINIPSNIITLGAGAFGKCTNITSAVIPDSIKSIPAYLFFGCSNLSSVKYSSAVNSFGNGSFSGTAITSFTAPDKVTTLNAYLFRNCTKLTNVDFGTNVKTISTEAFKGCTALTTLSIPSNVQTISDSAFSGCTSVTSLTLESGVAKLNKYCFYNCPLITSVNVPESVTDVGAYALGYIDGETKKGESEPTPAAVENFKITGYIGGSTSSLEKYAKEYPVAEFEVLGNIGETPYNQFEFHLGENGLVIDKYIGNETEVIIPSYIRIDINNNKDVSFDGRNRRVVEIGESAFAGNKTITSVVIPSKTEKIAKNAFNGCSNLKEADIENTLIKEVGEAAFLNTKVYSFAVPNTLETIGDYAFCYQLVNGEYSVLPDYDDVEITITKKKVEVTDADGNKVYKEDGKTVVTTEIEVENKKTTTIKVSMKGLSGSAAAKYAKAAKITYTAILPTTTAVTEEEK